ncbi:MAG: hypothetical protein LBJ45_00820 [Holosporaceae bacterium]|jgi:hypothetical protein|nr:hypothetical protein [Holosporaceae bacterium]
MKDMSLRQIFLVVALITLGIALRLISNDPSKSQEYLPSPDQSESLDDFFKNYEEMEQNFVAPLDENVYPLQIRKASLLNEKEMEYYKKNTWDPSKTLEQNRRMLTETLMKTCIDRIENFLSAENGVVLKVASQSHGIFLESAKIEELRQYDLAQVIYLMTNSPSFCRLARSLIAKYKTMQYRPQKAIFLFTKGAANHSSYSIAHYVLNLKTNDLFILSALDCKRNKMLFGATVFHEMLHWYHMVSDPVTYAERSKSTNCIRERFRQYQSSFFFEQYQDTVAQHLSNDEEYYTMHGLREENGEIVLDVLCEAMYTCEQYDYIRGSHLTFPRHFPEERDFIVNTRDSSLLKFFLDNASAEFGKEEFNHRE